MMKIEYMKPQSVFLFVMLIATLFVVTTLNGFQAAASTTSPARSSSQLYSKFCVACHGRDGKAQTRKGKFSHARDLTDAEWQDDVSDERLFNSIMNGRNVRGNMPAFSDKINDQEAESLVGLVRRF